MKKITRYYTQFEKMPPQVIGNKSRYREQRVLFFYFLKWTCHKATRAIKPTNRFHTRANTGVASRDALHPIYRLLLPSRCCTTIFVVRHAHGPLSHYVTRDGRIQGLISRKTTVQRRGCVVRAVLRSIRHAPNCR